MMTKKETNTDILVEIRCPACHRKLMKIRIDNKVAPLVELTGKGKR
jgi:ssDNA-binding Zn-finger/Zn-ribbon topoisomerase 1